MCSRTQDPQGINNMAYLDKKKFVPRILRLRGKPFEIEYLGAFDFISENNLGQVSAGQEGAIMTDSVAAGEG